MENKKDIGKAFREKLDGLQKQPGNAVWDGIKKDLPKKKPRFLPLFWIEASTAIKTVVITLLTTLVVLSGYFLIESDDHTSGFKTTGNSLDSCNSNLVEKPADTGNSASSHKNAEPNGVNKVVGNGLNNNSNSTLDSKGKKIPENTLGNNVKETNTASAKSKNGKPNLSNNNASSGTNKQSGIAGTSTTTTSLKNSSLKNSKLLKHKAGNANNGITGAGNESSYSSTNKNSRLAKGNTNFSNGKKGKVTLGKGDSAFTRTDEAKTIDAARNSDATKDSKDKIAISNNSNSITSESALNLTDTISKISDSLCDVATIENSATCKDTMEENTTKSNKAGNTYFKRFYIFAYTAPTSFTLSNLLTPDSLLVSNATATKVSYNYGAYIGYNFNKRWSMRTGINVTGLQQTIKNAFLQNTYTVVPGSENDPNGYVHLIAPANYAAINYTRNGSNAAVVQNLGSQQGNAAVNIIQKIEFAEVPVEIAYNMFGDKFGAGVFAGLSTIFTTKNIVYAQNNEGTLWLGSNKNVKDVGFTTTIGLHLYYRPLPWLQINAEPVFKYYLNTFNNSQPYSFGVQAGLQFNFDLFAIKK